MTDLERNELIQRACELQKEIERIFADVEHWNAANPDQPINPDPDGELTRHHRALTRMLRNGARLSFEEKI